MFFLCRHDKFMDAFNHISVNINAIYKQLTQSTTHPLGGTAYLSLDSEDEPYLHGIKYTAMPPTKRFRDMVQLSGGEKTVAALALLFAIHRYGFPYFLCLVVSYMLSLLTRFMNSFKLLNLKEWYMFFVIFFFPVWCSRNGC